MKLRKALLRLDPGSPERQAVDAGEIDAIIDYSNSNVILFPAARRALRQAEGPAPVASRTVANSLLVALPGMEYRTLLAGLEPVTLRTGEVLHEAGERLRHVYFPIDSVVCLLTPVDDNRTLGAGPVGYEGMVGISVVLGVEVSSVRAIVQATGTAMRIEVARFNKALRRCPVLQRGLYRYACAKLAIARQSAVCHSFHAAEARLARWMLLTCDRVMSKEFFLTQTFLAEALGVRRVTITQAAGRLQHRNLISYRRGRIRILDRRGLESAACRCYSKIHGVRNAD